MLTAIPNHAIMLHKQVTDLIYNLELMHGM